MQFGRTPSHRLLLQFAKQFESLSCTVGGVSDESVIAIIRVGLDVSAVRV